MGLINWIRKGVNRMSLENIVEINQNPNDIRFLESEIINWKMLNPVREDQLTGERYYLGDHDILSREREVIGENGELRTIENLPNNKNIDNQYAKMVDQKVNYFVGKPIAVETDNKQYQEALNTYFNANFMRLAKNTCLSCLNGGIAWICPYYDDNGEFTFKRLEPYETKAYWKDSDHTQLQFLLHVYPQAVYDKEHYTYIDKVEVMKEDGVDYYVMYNDHLYVDPKRKTESYVKVKYERDGKSFERSLNWDKVPAIPFKYNSKEIPMIKRLKSLQDGINIILSDFENNIQEDARNTILVLENYDGTDLGQFRRNLAEYGAVKVRSGDGIAKGDVRTLTVQVDSDNYKVILEIFKKALIQNARGYDASELRAAGNPNQMNIQSIYSDIDIDTNGMETEWQASMQDLLWFIKMHLKNSGQGDFANDSVKFVFNRDILINESEAIDNVAKSKDVISNETAISNHPWVKNYKDEKEKLSQEEDDEEDGYNGQFPLNSGINKNVIAKDDKAIDKPGNE